VDEVALGQVFLRVLKQLEFHVQLFYTIRFTDHGVNRNAYTVNPSMEQTVYFEGQVVGWPRNTTTHATGRF
jgi:hypothetical protein